MDEQEKIPHKTKATHLYYLAFAVIITISVFILAKFQTTPFSKSNKTPVSTENSSYTITPSPKFNKRFNPIFSGDKQLFVNLDANQQNKETYEFIFSIYDWEGKRAINIESNPSGSHQLLQVVPDIANPHYKKIYQNKIFNNAENSENIPTELWKNLVAISHTGSRIALLDIDKLAIYYSETKKEFDNGFERVTLNYGPKNQIQLTELKGTLSNFFFSGDESILFIETTDNNLTQLYGYTRETGLEAYAVSGFGFTELQNSNSIAYFSSSPDTYGSYSINLFNPRSKTIAKFLIPGQGVDAISNLTVSPNQQIACFEQSSSGFHGYVIYRLPDMYRYNTGNQYSFCENWIDNSKVIIRKKPFNNPSSVTHKLILDINTRQETFISVENYLWKQ